MYFTSNLDNILVHKPSFIPFTADIPQQPLIGPKIGFDGCYGYIFSYGYSPTSAIFDKRRNNK